MTDPAAPVVRAMGGLDRASAASPEEAAGDLEAFGREELLEGFRAQDRHPPGGALEGCSGGSMGGGTGVQPGFDLLYSALR